MDYFLQLFKAVANDRRLRIIELLLNQGELPLDEIAAQLKIPLATTCRNLKILEKAYLVISRYKEGYVRYNLNKPNEHIYNKFIIELVRLRSARSAKRVA